MRTRVKICGITRIEDALAAARAGADAIGFVFAEKSPRYIPPARARVILDALPPFVSTVGLFVDASPEQVREVLGHAPFDLLQFHGAETPEYCGQFGRPYIKAIRMAKGVDLKVEAARYIGAAGLLADSYHPQFEGGTGETFAWSRIPKALSKPVILAGGLAPENVAQAIALVRPYAVDVSTGVEQEKGIKDAAKIAAFIAAAVAASTA